MSSGIATIEVRPQRGQIKVQALGTTNKGQRYIKAGIALAASSFADPAFKSELEAVVNKLMA